MSKEPSIRLKRAAAMDRLRKKPILDEKDFVDIPGLDPVLFPKQAL
jgi:hypothetical protein